jgi:hypothetical protein
VGLDVSDFHRRLSLPIIVFFNSNAVV